MALNKEMLLRVADAIARENVAKFSMENWINPHGGNGEACGTSACVAGHAVMMDELDRGVSRSQIAHNVQAGRYFYEGMAANILGLDDQEAVHLFYGDGTGQRDWLSQNRCRAVQALRWMAETGRIDWEVALEATAQARP